MKTTQLTENELLEVKSRVDLEAAPEVNKTVTEVNKTVTEATKTAAEVNKPAHAPFSPSKLSYLSKCPSYESDTTPSSAAEEGTLLHKAWETSNFDILQTDEQKQQLAKIQKFCEKFLASGSVLRETYLDSGIPDVWGTADFIHSDGNGEVTIVDAKFGRGSIPAQPENYQALAYTLGAFRKFQEAKRVTFYFLSPRRDEVDCHVYYISDIPEILAKVQSVVSSVLEKRDKVHNTGHHCLWCSKKSICPAVTATALSVAQQIAPEKPLQSKLSVEHLQTPEQLAKALDVVRLLTDEKTGWAAQVKAKALAMARDELIQIPGYHLEEAQTKRTVADAVLGYQAVKEYLTIEEYLKATSVTAKAIEDLVGEKAPRGQKAKIKLEISEKLAASGVLSGGEKYFRLVKDRD